MGEDERKSDKRLHLQFVQNVITRMNTNSFQIKTWTITVFAAFLALAANSKNYIFVFISVFPTLIFYFLDAYYLQQESKFRGLYNDIIAGKIDCYNMPINLYKGDKYSYKNVLLSVTLWGFYPSISVFSVILTFIGWLVF